MKSIRKLAVIVAYSCLLVTLGYIAGSRAALAPNTVEKPSAAMPALAPATAVKPEAPLPMQSGGPTLTTEMTDWTNLTPEY